MVSVAGTQNRHGGTSPVKAARTEAEGNVSLGKSGQSVGHLAKAAIEMRLEQGEELARNALGKAAAAIAKMTFEQRTALLAPAADPEPTPDPVTEPASTPDPTAAATPPAADADATPAPGSTAEPGEAATPPVDPATDPAVTLLEQILADTDEASQPV